MTRSSETSTARDLQIERETDRMLQRVRERAWGIAAGVVCGLLLSLATIALVLRGGPNVGAHLGLLSVYLPGYSVSYVGSVIGFLYMLVIGGALGWLAGRLYNVLARRPGV